MRALSHNQIRLWRSCKRQYGFAYVQLRVPKKKPAPLVFGGTWDECLEAWHGAGTAQDKLLRASRVAMHEADPWVKAKLLAMLVGYSAMWGDVPSRLVATQVEFKLPIIHPVTGQTHPECSITGFIDAIVELDGRLVVLESKSSGEDVTPGSAFWQRVAVMDPQVSTYLPAARALGYDVRDCVYDVARKPELRPKKDETPEQFQDRIVHDMAARPEWYFQRQTLVRLDREEREHALDVWHYADEIVSASRTGRYPRNPDNCHKFGRACEYAPVCAGEASLDDPHLFVDAAKRERKKIHVGTDPARPAA
jgi:hypothetical protein